MRIFWHQNNWPFNIKNSHNTRPKYFLNHFGAPDTIYTDGSKTKQGVGSGFVVYYKNKLIHSDHTTLPFHTTVFQAEIHAILKAGQYIKSSRANRDYRFIKILSDSQAAVKALHTDRITAKIVYEAYKVWETLATDAPVVIAWIKAHVGHVGNELCLLYTSPSPRDSWASRMPSSAWKKK